jgi:hypothetical protein
MSAKPRNFPWSDEQIAKASKPRALPIYTDDEIRTREDLMIAGMHAVNAHRRGGRTRRIPEVRAEIRRMIIEDVAYPQLSKARQRTPNGENTLKCISEFLAKCDFNVSHETIRRDLKLIGTQRLRPR